jgi:hypothetical protein
MLGESNVTAVSIPVKLAPEIAGKAPVKELAAIPRPSISDLVGVGALSRCVALTSPFESNKLDRFLVLLIFYS